LPAIDFAHVDLAASKQRPEQHGGCIGGGSTVCVLILRLNSSCSRSIAFVVRTLRHWLGGRNIEMIWLTGQLAPDFETIADFRKDNGRAIRSLSRVRRAVPQT
jgi:hypothetical protein